MTIVARRCATTAVLVIVLGACGSNATQQKQPEPGQGAAVVTPEAADALLKGVLTGKVTGSAIVGDDGDLVIFGGNRALDGSGDGRQNIEVSRTVAVLHSDGSRDVFEIGDPMVDVADAVVIDRALYVVGRTCTAHATSSDTGIACSPGSFQVQRIGLKDRSVTNAPIDGLPPDANGATSAAMLVLDGRPVVLTGSREQGPRLRALTTDLASDGAIPAPRQGEVCSTGDSLIQLAVAAPRISGSFGPGDPLPAMAPAPAPVPLRRYVSGAKQWADSTRSPVVDFRHGLSMTCSKGLVSVLATGADDSRTLLVYDTDKAVWKQTEATLDVSFTAVVSSPSMAQVLVMNPAASSVVINPVMLTQTPVEVAGGPQSQRTIVGALGNGTFGQLGTDLKMHVLT